LSKTQFIYLDTLGWKSGKSHRIEIWYVEFNKRYYIISEHGEGAHWIQNIQHNPNVKFSVSNKIIEGTARVVNSLAEAELAAQISNLMDSKYKWSQGSIVEIRPLG
jgi:deazaflavin-dependent oxidoreductase (nitroreductase family)